MFSVKECGVNTDLPEIKEVIDEHSNDSSRRETRCKQHTPSKEDLGLKSECNELVENRSSQYESTIQDAQIFEENTKKLEDHKN